jgi:hypothetical protein
MFYAALERFDKDDGERWLEYARWLGRPDLQRVVTLDSMLCPPVVRIESDEDWQFVVCEDFMLDFFTDFEFVRRRASVIPGSLVVVAARDPSTADVASFSRPDFAFAGFDVVDTHCCASAILNCGGFPRFFLSRSFQRTPDLLLRVSVPSRFATPCAASTRMVTTPTATSGRSGFTRGRPPMRVHLARVKFRVSFLFP